MLNIKIICIGKMKEPYYTAAFSEYAKRLSTHCRMEVLELPEARLSQNPSPAEVSAALSREREEIEKRIPGGAYLIAMCVEGESLDSPGLAALFSRLAGSGRGSLCFLIGSSNGLDPELKKRADFRLSMSKMTFPHHLARVMLAEQIYRGIMINEGSKYHK